MIIRHCIDHAKLSLDLYEQSVRASGRTTRLIDEMKEGDVVVAHHIICATWIAKRAYEEKRIVVHAMSVDDLVKRSSQGYIMRGRHIPWSKVHFDSTALDYMLRKKLSELQNFIDKGYT